jgi:hypothetical protein
MSVVPCNIDSACSLLGADADNGMAHLVIFIHSACMHASPDSKSHTYNKLIN